MPKLIQKQLTVRRVAALSKPGAYGDGQGLYLQVSQNGHGKSWVLRYVLGRKREMGLGSAHNVTLAEAREAAHAARVLIRALIDPIEERAKRKTAFADTQVVQRIRFEEALDQWLRYKNLKGKHANAVESPIRTYIMPVLGKLPVADITPWHIYEALTTKTKTGSLWDHAVIGERTIPNLASLFAFAIAKGWRKNTVNPTDRELLKFVGLKTRKHEVKNHPACPYQRIPEYWDKLQARTDTSMYCLQWIVLNAARPKEARLLRWDWIDAKQGIATIPNLEMKGGREHQIPYSTAAATLLDKMREVRTCELVFPNHRDQPFSEDLFSQLARRVMPELHITAHGFRASFRTWASEQTNFETEMIEIALAHTIGTKVEQAYQRGSMLAKRRTLMDTWAAYCQTGRTDPRYRSEFVAAAD